jgi:hypothetical protein
MQGQRHSGSLAPARHLTAQIFQDLCQRIAQAVANASSISQAAARYEVSPSTAVN